MAFSYLNNNGLLQVGHWETNINTNVNILYSKILYAKWWPFSMSQWASSLYSSTIWLVTHRMSLTKSSFVHCLTYWNKKLSPFCRQFQMPFYARKRLHIDSNFIGICFQGSSWQYANIASDNGLTPTRRQTFIWNHDGLICWRIYVPLDLDVLNFQQL